MEYKDYKYLVGKVINKVEETKNEIVFYTDEEEIIIDKFIPYCACNVGEYVDEISINGECNGVITKVEPNIDKYPENDAYGYSEDVYRGKVSFFFEHGFINANVHGEDNGYYGVAFNMPVSIRKIEKDND